jgi:hypothetical protein
LTVRELTIDCADQSKVAPVLKGMHNLHKLFATLNGRVNFSWATLREDHDESKGISDME